METKSEMMKENKGRFPWRDWAKYEVVTKDGTVFQMEYKPEPLEKGGWCAGIGNIERIGSYTEPKDHTTTLIERYPSEQAAPAPFVFGPEDVGRRVRHSGGNKGVVDAIYMESAPNNQLVIKWNKGSKCAYSLRGEYTDGDGNIEVFLDEMERDQTPDLMARVEALETQLQTQIDALTERMDLEAKILDVLDESNMNYKTRIESLEAQVRQLEQTPGSEFDNLRFVLPENNTKSKAAKEAVFSGDEISRAFCKVYGETFGEQSPKDTYQFPMIRHKLRFVEPDIQPDPTAQKIDALKLLFEWRDGCEFMTVDNTGEVWQWSKEPINDFKLWKSKSGDPEARRVGQITPDVELSKILITRHVEQ